MHEMNAAAAVNDPEESMVKVGNKKGSPKNPKWSLSSGFIAGCDSTQVTVETRCG